MLLTITTTRAPATDIGYLLHKHPARFQEFGLAFGKAYVFYPEATNERCTAALLLDVDPIAMVRGKPGSFGSGPLDQYVNDRPYVASSFLSVAISQVFGSALRGTCKDKPDLVSTALPLRAKIAAMPCKGGEELLRSLFEPLGYRVTAARFSLDEHFPQWGESNYYSVELMKDKQFEEIVGMDVSIRSLQAAHRRLRLDDLPSRQKDRICLTHGSLMYRDRRLEGFDAAAAVEVVEHLDPPRLTAFERVVFEHARPRTVVLTTPNREYNVMWEDVGEAKLRHKDHRFEWTRAEFRNWAERTADRFGYKVRFLAVGPEDQTAGAPTQLGVFELCETPTNRVGSQEKA